MDRVSPAADSLSRLLRAQLYSPDPAAAVQAVTCEMTRMVDRLGEEVADVEIRRAVQQFERSLTPKDREEYERVQNLLDGQYLTFGCNPPAKSGESNGTGSRAVERSGAPPTMEKRGEVPPR